MKSKMAKEEEDLFFVGINDPVSLRREILLSTKNSIFFLKKNEEIKELRIKKIEKIMQFKNDMKELNALMNKLKEKLPKAKIRLKSDSNARAREGKMERREIKTKLVRSEPKKISELEKLEFELTDIEKKLERLR